jgi:hypothetical protein
MNKFELAVKLVVEDIKSDLDGYYKDSGIETWADYLDETGRDSADVKEDVRYTLASYSDFNNVDLYLNDCNELELEDGSVLTYRKLMNAVRKQLKSEGYFE